jgi:hypothetical protein
VARLLGAVDQCYRTQHHRAATRSLYAQMMFRGGGRPAVSTPGHCRPWSHQTSTRNGSNEVDLGGPVFIQISDPQVRRCSEWDHSIEPGFGHRNRPIQFRRELHLTGLAAIVSAKPGAYTVLDASVVGGHCRQRPQSKPVLRAPWQQSTQLPRRQTLDANVSKAFRLTENKTIQLRVDATNVLNHPNWNEPTLSIQSSNFGRTTGKGGPANRTVQAQVRFTF